MRESQDSTDALESVLAFDATGRVMWPTAELSSMLHGDWLEGHLRRSAAGHRLAMTLTRLAGPPVRTFWQLLQRKELPPTALQQLKEFAKCQCLTQGGSLPPDFARMLYYAAIAAALVRWRVRISRLDNDALREGFNWAARQSWVDQPTQQLLHQGLAQVRRWRGGWRWPG